VSPVSAPAPYHLPHALQGISTHSRQKIGKPPVLTADGSPWPKREAEEREVYMRIGCCTVAVLAIDHLRLLRMHRQPAFRQPQCDGTPPIPPASQ
jgi:hypothetical protein